MNTTPTAHVDWATVVRIGADRPVPHLLVVRPCTGDPLGLTDEVTLEPGDYLELVKPGGVDDDRWALVFIRRARPGPSLLDPDYKPRWGLLAWSETHHDIVAEVHRAIPDADRTLLADVYGRHWLPGLLADWAAEFEHNVGPLDNAPVKLQGFIPGKVTLLRELVQRLRWCQSVTGLPR